MTELYEKPRVHRFGTFRQLTRFGPEAGSDIGSVFGIAGCNAQDTESEFGCQATVGSR